MSFELKLAFLRELGASHKRALLAQERLMRQPTDAQAIAELHDFFHNIAGTAESVGLKVLGHLGAVCEGFAKLVIDHPLGAPEKLLQVFADGLAGVSALLDEHGVAPIEMPSTRWVDASMTQPSWSGDERVLSKILVI